MKTCSSSSFARYLSHEREKQRKGPLIASLLERTTAAALALAAEELLLDELERELAAAG